VNPVFAAALEVQAFCTARRYPSVSSAAWPRQTDDVDLTLLTGFGNEEAVVDALLAAFQGREGAIPLGIVLRQAGGLNEAQIFEELRPLLELKEAPEIEMRLRRLLQAERPKSS
jgi:hypothetical protein